MKDSIPFVEERRIERIIAQEKESELVAQRLFLHAKKLYEIQLKEDEPTDLSSEDEIVIMTVAPQLIEAIRESSPKYKTSVLSHFNRILEDSRRSEMLRIHSMIIDRQKRTQIFGTFDLIEENQHSLTRYRQLKACVPYLLYSETPTSITNLRMRAPPPTPLRTTEKTVVPQKS